MMPNELAAMAMVPNGATMTVEAICAPHMTRCCNAMGAEILAALPRT